MTDRDLIRSKLDMSLVNGCAAVCGVLGGHPSALASEQSSDLERRCSSRYQTVFKYTTSGELRVLYRFSSFSE
jgi:hypothetical protein